MAILELQNTLKEFTEWVKKSKDTCTITMHVPMRIEIITDIISTGKTLKANNLRVLKDGIILNSCACVLASKKSLINLNKRKIIKLFLKN